MGRRMLAPADRFGQCGSYWGNLLLPEGALKVDEAFGFTGEEGAVYAVKRVLSYPLDAGKRLYYFERKDRHRAPPDSAPS